MKKQYYSTSQIARAAQIHTNTVHKYEEWGYLPRIPRTPNGYRRFTEVHLDQMLLARLCLPGPYPGKTKPVYQLVRQAAQGNYDAALQLAHEYQRNIALEQNRAQEALLVLKAWSNACSYSSPETQYLNRKTVARCLGVTVDTLRTWERSGLLEVAEDRNGAKRYCSEDLDRVKVIRVLRQAGFSIMALRNMLSHYDKGHRDNLDIILNTPPDITDICYVTDRWITTLAEHESRAVRIIEQLSRMIEKNKTLP